MILRKILFTSATVLFAMTSFGATHQSKFTLLSERMLTAVQSDAKLNGYVLLTAEKQIITHASSQVTALYHLGDMNSAPSADGTIAVVATCLGDFSSFAQTATQYILCSDPKTDRVRTIEFSTKVELQTSSVE